MLRLTVVLALGTAALGCEGPRGPAGPAGPPGPAGDAATPLLDGGVVPDAAACADTGATTPGLGGSSIAVSAPANGSYFVAGEQPTLTIRLADRCGRALGPSGVALANLYVWGPRALTATKTAVKLLNAVTDRAQPQHHYIDLRSPSYADPSHNGLTVAADGTITYQLQPVSDEAPGTYTAGVWIKNAGDVDQAFPLADFQLGTATVEPLPTGAPDKAACFDCHRAPSGYTTMHHSHPVAGLFPFGNYGLDQEPISDCLACHNLDGYSPNPLVRKVHGLHRGEHQLAPGVAHPEYGLGADSSLADYTNVAFPAFPSAERECQKCHVDNQWTTSPSRLACGTCHDNLFFDSGTLMPPRVLGRPAAGACTADPDCASFGSGATCNSGTGSCQRTTHPIQTDDAQCLTCHGDGALAPTTAVHEVYQRTRARGLAVKNVAVAGGSGAGGSFAVADAPTVSFTLADKNGPVTDLATNAALSFNVLVWGPTDAPHTVLPASTSKAALMGGPGGLYTLTLPALPAAGASPLNTTIAGAPLVAGTYTIHVWVYTTIAVPAGQAAPRDEGVGSVGFALGGAAPLRPRQVVSAGACDRCHVVVQAHGGSRQQDPTLCAGCHNLGAVDRVPGAGRTPPKACSGPADCFAWEQCAPPAGSGANVCQLGPTDPTPNASVDLPVLVHRIHYARLLGGYAESGNSAPATAGKLGFIGFNDSLADLSEILMPIDVRNCTTCHTDAGGSCSSTMPCGAGQSCVAGACVNSAWTAPSARICLSCHDTAEANGHAALNTYMGTETCTVCHDTDSAFAVAKVHNVSDPFAPPYPREPETP